MLKECAPLTGFPTVLKVSRPDSRIEISDYLDTLYMCHHHLPNVF